MKGIIDAHIHLDMYGQGERECMLADMEQDGVRGLIAVSTNLQSCRVNQSLKRVDKRIFPAYGFHPEQAPPTSDDEEALFGWLREHLQEAAAIGEVGLPYYTRKDHEEKGLPFDSTPYLRLLSRFAALAVEADKPLVLHAVYEDADAACTLLEEKGVQRAHFHWFKGSDDTVGRMVRSGYLISITPDVLYEPEIERLAARYPLELMMVETDGPWPFEGPFSGQTTHPGMIRRSIEKIAALKGCPVEAAANQLYENAVSFYRLTL